MHAPASVIGQVFRCAWCHKAEPVRGGLLFFTYAGVDADGQHTVVAADAAGWSHSDGICPAHLAAVR
ncbi:MAG TPA: hypothetical protein VK066_21025 [Chloroflexota bacterium]|nr:hypothetical protein [Chloroflexota bacterium]